MEQPSAAMLVIGDELLSGRTHDANMHYLAKELTEIGINLTEARFIRDDPAAIVSSIIELSKRFDYLFTSGGIGPTHDDITAKSVAKAFGLKYEIHKEAFKILEDYYRNDCFIKVYKDGIPSLSDVVRTNNIAINVFDDFSKKMEAHYIYLIVI